MITHTPALMLPLHDMGHMDGGLGWGSIAAVAMMGAFHGINPGMGWLFATSYGLQEKSRKAILRSMVPIVIGHELSVLPIAVAVVLFASQLSRAVALSTFAVGLVGFGIYLLLKKRHFSWVGMRLRPWELAWWSFLMSTVTGAGLMLAPIVLHVSATPDDLLQSALGQEVADAALLALLHAAVMGVTALVTALLVYDIVGLKILRTAWINLDKIWAAAFVGAGLFVWLG